MDEAERLSSVLILARDLRASELRCREQQDEIVRMRRGIEQLSMGHVSELHVYQDQVATFDARIQEQAATIDRQLAQLHGQEKLITSLRSNARGKK